MVELVELISVLMAAMVTAALAYLCILLDWSIWTFCCVAICVAFLCGVTSARMAKKFYSKHVEKPR